ncbi:MAG: sugar ABC transporter ATP-binding protein [Chloroflexota bacterium]|nr:sugar ABC transporter ATP-binding protein [Chloroflexota bacterium]
MTLLLNMTRISKQFPGVRALDEVALEVERGEIHGLLGENGAGKSTLLKILSGAHRPDSGTITLDGQTLHFDTPQQAQSAGVVTIYQEFNLVPQLTIAENVFIGREPGNAMFFNWRRLATETRALTDRLGISIDPLTMVRDLSVAEQQMVEIARAISMRSRLIIMDEPTSALSETEVERLFGIMRDLREQGLSIIFVSHRLEEVMRICNRITVLRDGRNAGTAAISDITIPDIIRMMVGRTLADMYQGEHQRGDGEMALRVRNLNRRGNAQDPHAILLKNVSFDLYKGEILGIAGLVGAGRTEIARAIFGADAFSSADIEIDGKPVRISSPRDAIRQGIGLIPEDRKQQALFLSLTVRQNFSIASLGRFLRLGAFVDERNESTQLESYRQSLNIRMTSPEQRVGNLSGGNQQKVVIARWLAMNPKILIVDEPTRGIDVSAKAEVHALLHQMAGSGIAVIMISSELSEILGMSDRIITISEGRLTGEIARKDASEERLMAMMSPTSAPLHRAAQTN